MPIAPSLLPETVRPWRSFLALLRGLTKFCVAQDSWGSNSDGDMGPSKDRDVAELADAHVVSSLRTWGSSHHAVVLDIDHDAWLVPSSTPGHSHLYVDLICHETEYFDFLRAAAKIGLIEEGYAAASIERGHSDVRLPWVVKGENQSAAERGLVGVIPL